jgi:hypothetical protein
MEAEEKNGYGSFQPSVAVPSVVNPTLSQGNIVARFYWNDRFQSVLERSVFTKEDARQKESEIRDLLKRFVDAAVPVCETIV